MTDLPGQILAAIEETERIARAATTGHWTVKPNTYWFDAVLADGGHWVAEIADRDDALHFAHNDPAIVLRMCAAHRATLAEHKPIPDGSGFADGLHCAVCLNQREIENDYPEYWTPQTYPCLTIRSLAAGYGIPLVEEDRTA